MEWEGREESQNVEDRRAFGKKAGVAIGGAGGILVVILALVFGLNPQGLTEFLGKGQGEQQTKPADPEEERQASFSKVVFRDTEVVWTDLFNKMRPPKKYRTPVLVLYSRQVNSACGSADSSVGPFYCPGDQKVYIDLSFYKDMERKLNAPGEFARAYVIAHEVGHHVQRQLGYSARVDEARERWGPKHPEYNKMSVRLELQADFLAGVWAHHGQKKFKFLEPGDLQAAIKAAYEIGDDRLQKRSRGVVVPHSFTHGTSEQRMRWFQDGFETGDVNRARKLFDLSYNEL